MSRQRPDALETRQDLGPLFTPRVRELTHVTDPHTSVKAAATAIRSGTERKDSLTLGLLICAHPGMTMPEYGAMVAAELGGDAYQWRLKLGRRTGTMKERGLIHARGERDGCARWWPGPATEVVP